MMKEKRDTIRHLLFAATLLLSAASGCVTEPVPGAQNAEDPAEPIPGEISLTLNLSLHDDGASTRADGDEPLRPGVDDSESLENKITALYLFWEDTDEEGTPSGDGTKRMFRFSYPEGAGNQLRLSFKGSELTFGWKRIFVGANLSAEQARHFAENNREYTVPQQYRQFGYGLSEAYAPGHGIGLETKYPESGYERTDMAMFCTEGQALLLERDKLRYAVPKPFTLKRNVAKVLTTCKAEEGYCALAGDLLYPAGHELAGEPRGWIRQADVRFLVNALNNKSFIMQKSEWNTQEGRWEYFDPNYDRLTDYFTFGSNGIPIPTVDNDFYYNAVQTLNGQSAYYVGTVLHDDRKIPVAGSNNADKYYEGLYCPENTFTADDLSDTDRHVLTEYNYPWPMITHVSITAKFTPKELYVEREMSEWIVEDDELTDELKSKITELIDNGKEMVAEGFGNQIVTVDSPSEEVSQALLTASLRYYYQVQEGDIYEHTQDGFPRNTYLFVADREGLIGFYTYGAALVIAKYLGWDANDPDGNNDPKHLASFTAMPRGRGYYYTYIDNRRDSEKSENDEPWANSQVERNVYYILTIDSFSGPGRTGSEPEYVKVHTHVAEWKYGGEADVELN